MSTSQPSVFHPGNTALITGGASGIGLALATKCKSANMNVIICDINTENLSSAQTALEKVDGSGKVKTLQLDVSQIENWEKAKELVESEFENKLHLLALNAGRSIAAPSKPWSDPSYFTNTLATNTFGITNGLCALLPYVTGHEESSSIIITGSKQGITNPPGNAAYNASKAAVKSLAESLSFTLKDKKNTSVHLLVPGWTFTGMTGGGGVKEKPKGAWFPGQVVEYLVQKMQEGKFYVIVPDNDVSEEMDRKRMLWDRLDLVEGRPPLTRWRREFDGEFREWSEKNSV
ncbi:NAD(P)-binding Rossmann-fold containing protein [Glarea lozoyensis ATCC 20868]|uniref:NAD(P)-binding Rossmann-fold containing protein n=1 Tax=Glarea lozoyensis (strain ATCC 20868 / MF5171) TaxID=1116229 RepID=S3CGG1_GLAL2|nr:NAD(P)-binding Rossmann-fold containing protein [Glarea lozoyensis ATCC 20868]EPE25607.1 NAD(P)-binding Rossmann-fold containing protein [Glarea lozoyensis ATCC 20868]